MRKENRKFAEQLALSFHEQFAQNQNHRQGMFVQVLAVVVTVLVGFGYAYTGLQNGSGGGGNAANVALDLLYAFLMISMVLLSLAIALVVDMAYGFRRDQTTACRIRVNAGAMKAKKDSDNCRIFFPAAYNPVRKTGCCWMPGYHSIFYIALLVIKGILIVIVCGSIENDKYGFLYCASFIVVVISLCSDVLVWWRYYRRKWEKVSEHAERILKL